MRKTPALLAAAIAATTVAALPAVANASTTTTTAPTAATATPTFDYSDCPRIPAGVDPAKWRCEVMVATGTMTVNGTTIPFRFDRVTHAEGYLPDGTESQVFGAFRAANLEVPGRQSGNGHGPKLWLRPHLVTPPDFFSQDGAMSLTLELSGPRLGDHCSIGTADAPVAIAAARVAGTTQWLSQDPPIITFDVQDSTLTVPGAKGCGRSTHDIDRRFGLPSPTGANRLEGTAYYSFKTYDKL
ncbi:hypothetical protein GCM10009839_17320 [Catenulispora yoronensis]|uniref:Secreted protein n=1 Tax=Catenulispora yoronensis TaxID=450799 RepID=A0ABN2TUS5_9ACTN